MWRTVTVTTRAALSGAHGSDLGMGEEAETAWHARGQEFKSLTSVIRACLLWLAYLERSSFD